LNVRRADTRFGKHSALTKHRPARRSRTIRSDQIEIGCCAEGAQLLAADADVLN
jgi:hypothetical protein